MKYSFFPLAFSLLISMFFCLTSKGNSIQPFLKSKGTKVDLKEITDFIPFFLDPRYRQKKVFWYTADITSADGDTYENVNVKFNTVSNTVYLKDGSQIYRIMTSALQKFTLKDKNQTRVFQKGYSGAYVHTIIVKIKTDILEGLRYITEYADGQDINIFYVEAGEISPGVKSLKIKFNAQGMMPVNDLQKYLTEKEHAVSAQLVSDKPEFNESNFLELKISGTKGKLLKLNYKETSHGQNMTLIKQTDTNTYNHNIFYISNKNNEIVEIQLNKKSIKEALIFAGAEVPEEMPVLRNEKQITSWLKKIL